jgi:uncharacterized protein (UPF0276 family)
MKNTQAYRDQHDDICHAAGELSMIVAGGDAAAIRKALSRLSGVLDGHLLLENSSFYPALFKHADPELRRIAKVYQDSMGKLAHAYAEFHARWMHVGAIENDRDGFAKDLVDVVGAIEKRIRLENTTLYLMVDRLANAPV